MSAPRQAGDTRQVRELQLMQKVVSTAVPDPVRERQRRSFQPRRASSAGGADLAWFQ
jgi:hypothetical protein